MSLPTGGLTLSEEWKGVRVRECGEGVEGQEEGETVVGT